MLTIGKLGDRTGVKVPTIRYYEQIGLLPEAERSSGNQRLYSRVAEERLRFIRHARDLGFPLEAIRDLLSLSDQPDQPCAAADSIARTQLGAVRERISRLKALEHELERMVVQCAHGTIGDCRVIEVLGDHSLCNHDHRAAEGEAGPGQREMDVTAKTAGF
ncbi:helix-turn-helix domain-containing protein [Paracoccus sp. IB05]|uniref:MerR family transcriptional regulator n=1 Tax=Paracoccus sp. IB05 TaxID=2779367 RepID=UPI0018E8510B|nr:helix-turn-helix domain-containing protein [Paracoccus sp. IB05]MBJ2151194.1 helix-turn-helix domain-containing protein [Paracoccus sp. IB05]